MLSTTTKRLVGKTFLASALLFSSAIASAKPFNVCWSIYVGWMPWGYAAEQKSSTSGQRNTGLILKSPKSMTTLNLLTNTPPVNLMPAP